MAPPAITNWRQLLKFRCTGCGNCCKGTIVMLTDSDVRRIVEGTGMAPREFVRFFGEHELIMNKRHPFWVRLANRQGAMALRWGRQRCIFLDREDRCSIYEHRPLACREHPFTIRLSNRGAVESLALSKASECLYELDGNITRPELAAVSLWNEEESAEYQRHVKAWNRDRQSRRTRAAFIEFLGLEWEYGSRRRKSSKTRTSLPSFG